MKLKLKDEAKKSKHVVTLTERNPTYPVIVMSACCEVEWIPMTMSLRGPCSKCGKMLGDVWDDTIYVWATKLTHVCVQKGVWRPIQNFPHFRLTPEEMEHIELLKGSV